MTSSAFHINFQTTKFSRKKQNKKSGRQCAIIYFWGEIKYCSPTVGQSLLSRSASYDPGDLGARLHTRCSIVQHTHHSKRKPWDCADDTAAPSAASASRPWKREWRQPSTLTSMWLWKPAHHNSKIKWSWLCSMQINIIPADFLFEIALSRHRSWRHGKWLKHVTWLGWLSCDVWTALCWDVTVGDICYSKMHCSQDKILSPE